MAFTFSAHAARYGVGAVLPGELRLPVDGRGERSRADVIRVIIGRPPAVVADRTG